MVALAKEAKFPLGRLVATPGALAALANNRQEPLEFLSRHVRGDWGDVDDDDKQSNNVNIMRGGRLLSAYKLNDGTRIWLITEADRSYTTILLPEEY